MNINSKINTLKNWPISFAFNIHSIGIVTQYLNNYQLECCTVPLVEHLSIA